MTEKVKIPQEVADAIKYFRTTTNIYNDERVIRDHAEGCNDWLEEMEGLNGVPLLTLVDALRIGYDIEPEPLKVGDWVKHYRKSDGVPFVGKIVEITAGKAFAYWNGFIYKGFIHVKDLTKMTTEEIKGEQERQKWAGIEEGDVLRLIPMAHVIAIYQGDADDESILVKNDFGQHLWRKSQVELYAKKVGEANA